MYDYSTPPSVRQSILGLWAFEAKGASQHRSTKEQELSM
jgi:hypothetical protein